MGQKLETPLDRIKAAAKEGQRVRKWAKGGRAARAEAERLSRIDPYVTNLNFRRDDK